MTEFTASNGIKIKVISDGQAEIVYPRTDNDSRVLVTWARPDEMKALREYVRHERDKELGRWRWPENPDFTVYSEDDGVHIVANETTGLSLMATRAGVVHYRDEYAEAARAYFEIHPERKPWHDAKTGEVWVITVDGDESAWTVNNKDKFENPDSTYELTNRTITAARRIWPVSGD